MSRTSILSVVFACCIIGRLAQDTTPPLISVILVHAFIFHVLVVVQIDEPGNIWCGAVLRNNHAPSSTSIKTATGPMQNSPVATAAVAANTPTGLAVHGLSPSTAYDIYCYAEDSVLNPVDAAGIAATLHQATTISGGDYISPTFSYFSPTSIVEPRIIKLYVTLNEEGTVWCVLKLDTGGGTTTPTKGEVVGNINVDSWATASMTAANSYQGVMFFGSLLEASTYDAYCFATDLAGNGIDGTPASPLDTTAILNTKLAGLTTPSSLTSSFFEVYPPSGTVHFLLEPAVSNNYLPRRIISGDQERRDFESFKTPLIVVGELVNLVAEPTRGCDTLPVNAPGFVWMAVVRRGGCTFREKAKRAYLSGYSALIVIDFLAGTIPDMVAPDPNDPFEIPAWLISPADGASLTTIMNTNLEPFKASIGDLTRKPVLGANQCDLFGCRNYITQ